MEVKDHANISLRQIKKTDRSFLLHIYATTREDVRTFFSHMSQLEKDAFIKMQFECRESNYQMNYPEAEYMIIVIGKVDIGRLYYEEWPSQYRIMDIIIDPAYRSRGIGSAVLSKVIGNATSKNKGVSLHVDKINPAVCLYERLGFKIKSSTEIYHYMVYELPKAQKMKMPMIHSLASKSI